MVALAGKKNCDQGFSCKLACIAKSKACVSALSGAAQQQGKWLAHQADHLGENVVAWKIGKVAGEAIANVAVAHGAPPLVTQILAETAVQATAATAIHYAKHRDATPQDLAAHFVQQASAAFLGKDAHFFAEQGMDLLRTDALYHQLGPLVAGKFTGLGTAMAMSRSGFDRQVVSLVMERSKADLNRVRGFFDRLSLSQLAELEQALEQEAMGLLLYEALILALAVEDAIQSVKPASSEER